MSHPPKIYVAGHLGMVGAAIVRALQQHGQTNIVTRTHAELDLTNQAAVQASFASEKPNQVYMAAAKVGGIHANNTYPAEFIYQNLMVEANASPISPYSLSGALCGAIAWGPRLPSLRPLPCCKTTSSPLL